MLEKIRDDVNTLIANPSRIIDSLVHAYFAIGTGAYSDIAAALLPGSPGPDAGPLDIFAPPGQLPVS